MSKHKSTIPAKSNNSAQSENSKKVIQNTLLSKTDSMEKNIDLYFSGIVELFVDGKKLINESELVINSCTKYFLTGHNGSGKSTLMKYIYEKLKNDHDILMIDQDIKIESSDQTIQDFILHANSDLYTKHKKMRELEEIDDLTDDQNDEYNKLAEYTCSHNWDRYKADSNKILNGLGFNDAYKKVSLLSGGWLMRLALGKALLYKPDILLCDESTNHLDINASIWLMEYLTTYTKTIVMITHELDFINTLADYVWWIGNDEGIGTKLYTIKGKYINLVQFREQTKKAVSQKYEKLQKRIKEMRRKSVTKKKIEDLIKSVDAPRPVKEYDVSIEFEEIDSHIGMKNILELRDVSFGYSGLAGVGVNILNNIDYAINLKSRHVIVGDNGAGKTTLFKLCAEKLSPTVGEIIKDQRTTIGYFNQMTIDNLPLELSCIEYLQTLNSALSIEDCRRRLGRIGLKKIDNIDVPVNKVGNLSGGQRSRLAFCAIQLVAPSVILLDEPTNNLDITSIEALINAVNNFNGAIIVITHNTHFIESIENCEIYEIKNGSLKKFNGDFGDYRDLLLDV